MVTLSKLITDHHIDVGDEDHGGCTANLGDITGNLVWPGNSLEGNWQLRPYIAASAGTRARRKGFR